MSEMLITTILSAITGLGGFIYGVKKDKADLVSKSLQNIQSQILIYEQIIEGLRTEVGILVSKIEEQQKIISHLEKKIEDCFEHRTNI